MEEEQSELEDEIEDPDEYSQRYDEIQKMIEEKLKIEEIERFRAKSQIWVNE